jgi:hypothetical protein
MESVFSPSTISLEVMVWHIESLHEVYLPNKYKNNQFRAFERHDRSSVWTIQGENLETDKGEAGERLILPCCLGEFQRNTFD